MLDSSHSTSRTFLNLSDVSTTPPTLVKRWSSQQGALLIGRGRKDQEKEAQDPSTPFFRSEKTKVMSSSDATLVWRNGNPLLADSHSTNKTFVNGQELSPGHSHTIVDGDEITFGRKVVSSRHHNGESGEPLVLLAEVSRSTSPLHRQLSLSPSASPEEDSNHCIRREKDSTDEDEGGSLAYTCEDEELDVLDRSSDRIEDEDNAPESTLAPRPLSSQIKKYGFGLSQEDLLANSSEEEGEGNEDVNEEEEVEKERRQSPSIEKTKEFFDSIDSTPWSRIRKNGKRAESVDRVLHDEPDARSPFSSRLPSPVSPAQDQQERSSTTTTVRITTAALDLSTPSSESFSRFEGPLRFNFRRAINPPFTPPTRSRSSSHDVETASFARPALDVEKEDDVFSQASQLPSPQLSTCSSLEVDSSEIAQRGGEGEEGSSAGCPEPLEPFNSYFCPVAKLEKLIDDLAAKEEEENKIGEAETTGEDGHVGKEDTDGESYWMDGQDESGDSSIEGDGEKDDCGFDELDPPPFGVTAADLNSTIPLTNPEVFEPDRAQDGSSDGRGRMIYVDPDFDDALVDPDFDQALREFDSVIGGDPDVDEVDPDDSIPEVYHDDENAYPIVEEDEEESKMDSVCNDPEVLKELSDQVDAADRTDTPTAVETGFSRPSLKRRLSDTDLVEEEGGVSTDSLVVPPAPASLAPPLKRRRISAHVATFAFGLFTGVMSAVAGLSALGAALEEDD
ncbi:uncharacterized protein JCM6883_005175 [Sporobolomyces salmoneus]|uniref:uncharacterized protein n=1 Tax=Sporobolomyces salmoneus TaxID=183962 RepID=UPI00317DE728